MSPVPAHLILSHVPLVMILLGCCLLISGAWWKREDLKKGALGVFVLAAVLVLPLYLSGEPSQDAVKGLPGISDRILDQHEALAAPTLACNLLLGIIAGAGFFLFRAAKSLKAWFTCLVLVVSLLATALLAWTANLGGQIRHSEIRAVGVP